jgi:hypothetical protein
MVNNSILGISSLSSKLGYNFNENWYLEEFRPEKYDSDKCDLKMAAIAAIMVAILAPIFNMVAKTHKQFWSAHISVFVEIGALRNFTHFGGHLDRHFEIALVTITFL